jgi:hypothetical protein
MKAEQQLIQKQTGHQHVVGGGAATGVNYLVLCRV